MEQGVRRLLRSRSDRVLGGVCGGLGRYLNVDPVLLRIAAVALALSGGAGVIAYIVAWIVIPEDTGEEPPGPPAPAHRHGIAVAVGAGLIALGALLVLRDVLPWFGWVFWPVVVVGVGVLVLISARR
ncbi:MAG TPA: PspC domain-containing protein [Nakamurella sp.]